MRGALLCPGPSLPLFTDLATDYAVRIAINRAVSFAECQWWAIIDWQRFTQDRPPRRALTAAPTPRLFVKESCLQHLASRPPACHDLDRFRPLEFGQLQLQPSGVNWKLYTAPAALVLAHNLGVTDLDCFGCDWTDEPDWDGECVAGTRRDQRRWQTERVIWDQLLKWLDPHMTVRRILANGAQ